MRFRRAEEEEFRPELTPLVDVVFQLIIFFMVSTVFVEFTRQIIVLPEPSRKSAVVELIKSYTVEVNSDEEIFLDGKEIPLGALAAQLEETSSPRSVVIRADKHVSHGLVMRIWGLCEGAGITDIGVALQ